MSARSYFLDRGVGETRGVVMLDDRPERLLIERDGERQARLGARYRARVRQVEMALGSAFLDLGDGSEALLAVRAGEPGTRVGEALTVEIKTEARTGKLAVARFLEPAQGAAQLLAAGPNVAERLALLARDQPVHQGREARDAADEAQDEALASVHALPGGGAIAIEPTRALVAVDVDLGERKGGEGKRVTRQANLAAIPQAARLLRLKGLGGLVVIDLAGRGHDGPALLAAARAAFAPDQPGVVIGPVGRFGAIELVTPRRARPVGEILCDTQGRISSQALAARLLRRIEDEAAGSGARLEARCSPGVAQAAAPLTAQLAARIGARFEIVTQADWPGERMEVMRR